VTVVGGRADRPLSAALTDGELMANVSVGSVGSVESFDDLYDRYRERAHHIARVVCHDDGRAQEAVQDGFLSVWGSRANYRPQQGTVKDWLLTVVRCRAIGIVRSNHKQLSRRVSEDQITGRCAADGPLSDPVDQTGAAIVM
jgi:RNA polymerase sigma factor (sigma-70 family)